MSGIFRGAGSGGGGAGDVTGPASSTDNAVARFDGATGKIIQNSTAILSDAGALSTDSLTLTGTPLGETSGGTGQSTYTTGDILYASAANTLSKLPAGTNGYKLEMVSGSPSWTSQSGNKVLLSTQTASSSASLEFTSLVNSSLYYRYEFELFGIKAASDSVNLFQYWSTDNGSTYLATNYQWIRKFATSAGASGVGASASDTEIDMLDIVGNAANEDIYGYLIFFPNIASSWPRMFHELSITNRNTAQLAYFNGIYTNTTSTAINAFKFQMSSGNIQTGSIKMYGILA